jgi:hypothetical protein
MSRPAIIECLIESGVIENEVARMVASLYTSGPKQLDILFMGVPSPAIIKHVAAVLKAYKVDTPAFHCLVPESFMVRFDAHLKKNLDVSHLRLIKITMLDACTRPLPQQPASTTATTPAGAVAVAAAVPKLVICLHTIESLSVWCKEADVWTWLTKRIIKNDHAPASLVVLCRSGKFNQLRRTSTSSTIRFDDLVAEQKKELWIMADALLYKEATTYCELPETPLPPQASGWVKYSRQSLALVRPDPATSSIETLDVMVAFLRADK